ncbi:lipid-A-disaccharide synthase [Aquicella lusitana]|uniref:Lipid-A-disaccharide synthase n=1 Tax=Aquicella lusitana TaxID=254246 RepID=A0A370GD90_9COXI|nr:lipid-A-disaccharide synthase [Aquicella lusitana]RDI41795.1 lipid-A-disaccharide synthase [Aquicella lusitana]VVC73704.1 Lipid-A-disaccharide synthase [Aquicella lusitana]
MKIGIVAGEASGDLLGAKLIQALRERCPTLEVYGMGGPAMSAAGCESLFDIERLAVMGFIEPLLRLPDLIRLRRDLYRYFLKNRPDVFIGIDSPDFNLGLELKLRQAGIPVVHYVSPSVWAWRQNRIHKIAKAVDLMLTLLPFEAKFYEKHHVPVRYVGHPLADQIPLQPDKIAARRALCIDENATYVALLPGSRRQEIRFMAEPFLLAAKQMHQKKPDLRFLTSHVSEQRYQEFHAYYKQYAPDLPLHFFTRRSHDVMAAADVVLVTSGTATLETMLYKKPMIIAYRMSPMTYQLAKLLVKVPYIGLPNLLANRSLVPELIQHDVNPETICKHALDYLDHPEKVEKLVQIFTEMHKSLRAEAASNIAESILDTVHKKS